MIRYVTRWALTSGIRRVDGEWRENGRYFTGRDGDGCRVFVSRPEAHETLEQAIICARAMAKNEGAKLEAKARKFLATTWEPKFADFATEDK